MANFHSLAGELREMIYDEFLAASPSEDPTRTNVLLACKTIYKELAVRIFSTTEFRLSIASENSHDTSRVEENLDSMPTVLRKAISKIHILTPESSFLHLQLIHLKGVIPTSYKIMYTLRNDPEKLRSFTYTTWRAVFKEIFTMNAKVNSIQPVMLLTRPAAWYVTGTEGRKEAGVMAKRSAELWFDKMTDYEALGRTCESTDVYWHRRRVSGEDGEGLVLQKRQKNGGPLGKALLVRPFVFTSDESGA